MSGFKSADESIKTIQLKDFSGNESAVKHEVSSTILYPSWPACCIDMCCAAREEEGEKKKERLINASEPWC